MKRSVVVAACCGAATWSCTSALSAPAGDPFADCATGSASLRPVKREHGSGTIEITAPAGRPRIDVQARRMEPSRKNQAYEVWLYNSRADARSIGAAQADRHGYLHGSGELPDAVEGYRFIDVSREKIDRRRGHSGDSVLRARLRDLC